MKKNNIISFFLLFLFCSSFVLSETSTSETQESENVTVETKYFNVTGKKLTLWTLNKTITEFLGVPYAYKQTSSNRFYPPIPLNETFNSILNGSSYTAFSPATTCPQYIYRTNFSGNDFLLPTNEIGEDCLQLNMWVPPKNPYVTYKLPVIVFIYGGSFATGSASLDPYNGSVLAATQKVIVITLNYRVGPLGFAYFGENTEAKGNMGLLDQQEGLKWIYENIHFFNGSQTDITLFGHSAGAASVTAHLLSNKSHPYFSRIIVHSGAITNVWATVPSNVAYNNTMWLASIVNCTKHENGTDKNKNEIIKCMQNVNDTLLNDNQFTTRDKEQPPLPYTFLPIYNDTIFFGKNLFQKIKDGDIKKGISALYGRVKDEGSYFLPFLLGDEYGCGFNQSLPAEDPKNQCDGIKGIVIFAIWFKLGAFFKEFFQEEYSLAWEYSLPLTESTRDKAKEIFGDFMFNCDTELFANISDNTFKKNSYYFQFNKRSTITPWPQWMGVMHGYELEYVFGMPYRYPERYNESVLEFEKNFSTRVMTYYGVFASSGLTHSNWEPFKMSYTTGQKIYNNDKCAIIDEKITEENHKFDYTTVVTDRCKLLNKIATNHPPRDVLKPLQKKTPPSPLVWFNGFFWG
uniref:Acetylcholinesterase n=1 Tax=Parastrongyloides trichosuri TaxID=131310 RepID=A0A0N4ZZS1_PARTI